MEDWKKFAEAARQGVQVSAPFGNVRYALQVFEALDEFKDGPANAEARTQVRA